MSNKISFLLFHRVMNCLNSASIPSLIVYYLIDLRKVPSKFTTCNPFVKICSILMTHIIFHVTFGVSVSHFSGLQIQQTGSERQVIQCSESVKEYLLTSPEN